MPYPGVPKSKTAAMERCVARLKGKKGINPYAVCHASIMGGTKRAIRRKNKGRK